MSDQTDGERAQLLAAASDCPPRFLYLREDLTQDSKTLQVAYHRVWIGEVPPLPVPSLTVRTYVRTASAPVLGLMEWELLD